MHFNADEARKTIMNHYMKPTHKHNLTVGNFQTTFSNTCSDKLELELQWDNDVLVDAKFNGHGCAIFIASTDLFIDLIKGKTKAEIIELSTLLKQFVNQEEISEADINKLEQMWVFYNVKTHLNRVNCALLTSNTFLKDNE
ncbi:Fe-S cluster assembly sulfur transfer protein SufU [Mycoplasma hafezii]|uniref:Fe-S cluster assembly sulfur transfer protein SufU n=1 Tax=Mycoplasma hafezii TaxID=525886 RepID=UPI003CF4A07B